MSIYVPPWFFFRRISTQSRPEFLESYSEKRNIIIAYEILGFIIILALPVISLFTIHNILDWMKPFLLLYFTGNSPGILHGLFEILTVIYPKHGISFHAYHREYYLLHPDV